MSAEVPIRWWPGLTGSHPEPVGVRNSLIVE
jgi:hypothetical protein